VVNERSRKLAIALQDLWLKSSEQLEDKLARKVAVDYQLLRAAHAVKIYAIKYGSKLVQKRLPAGVGINRTLVGCKSESRQGKTICGVLGTKESMTVLRGSASNLGFPKRE
jgi:hypothetical protein